MAPEFFIHLIAKRPSLLTEVLHISLVLSYSNLLVIVNIQYIAMSYAWLWLRILEIIEEKDVLIECNNEIEIF